MINKFECYIGETDTKEVKVKNSIDQPPYTTVPPLKPEFSAVFDRLEGKHFPINKTIYFNENYGIEDEHGDFITDDKGYGIAGTTDGEGKLTLNYALPALSLTAPTAGTKYKLSESFNVTWTSSNITLVNVILESESGGYKKYSDVDATLGTLAVAISASDGFSINETVYIYIENTHQTVEDSVQVQSIATPTITALTTDPASPKPATNFVFSGESTYLVGEELTLQYSTDDSTWLPLGVATVQGDGTWSKDDCQIADAGTYYLRAIYGAEVVVSASISVTVESGSIIEILAGGSNYGMAIWDGLAYGWGVGSAGRLGTGNSNPQPRPYPVAVDVASSLNGKTVKKVSCGQQHTLFLCTDGTVHACGDTVSSGAIGDGGTTNRLKPVAVAVDADSSLNGKTVVDISAGLLHSLALDSDGGLHAWGANKYGEIGDNTTTVRRKPVAVSTATSLNGKTVMKVFGGAYRSFCICSDGTVHGWGRNQKGMLGDNSTTDRSRPVQVSTATSLSGKTVVYVAPEAGYSTLFLCSDGTVHGCGENSYSAIGDNTTTQRNQPVATNVGASSSLNGKKVLHIAMALNGSTSYAVCDDGTIHAWGANSDGQVGDNTTTRRTRPVQVSTATSLNGKTVTQCAGQLSTGLCVCSDGTAHGWGKNTHGQIGDNTNVSKTQPVEVDKTLVE